MRRVIEQITEIDAPPAEVWRALAAVDSYPEWNPFLELDRFPTAVGDRLRVTVKPGARTMRFRPTVITYRPGAEVTWRGRFLVPGVFDGEHTLAVEELPGSRTRFVHRELFRGVIVRFGGKILRDTEAGFAAMNSALRERVESTQPGA